MLLFLIHLKELKIKFYYMSFCFLFTFVVSYSFIPQLINIISTFFINIFKTNNFDFVFISVFEVFSTYLVLSFFVSFFFCFPFILYILFTFIKSGLFLFEKQFLFYIIKTIVRFLIVSCFFCFFFLLPCFLYFLFDLNVVHSIEFIVLKSNVRLYDYSILICKSFFIYCYIVFQIPTFISIFIFLKQPKPLLFFKFRRFFFITSFFLGCFFSSSDLLSFFLVSLFLFFLFELFVFLSILKNKYLYFHSLM